MSAETTKTRARKRAAGGNLISRMINAGVGAALGALFADIIKSQGAAWTGIWFGPLCAGLGAIVFGPLLACMEAISFMMIDIIWIVICPSKGDGKRS